MDFVNGTGACGGDPVGGQCGPRDGTGPGSATSPANDAWYEAPWVMIAAGVGALTVAFCAGWYARRFKYCRKHLPSKYKNQLQVAYKHWEDTKDAGKMLDLAIALQKETFAREKVREEVRILISMITSVVMHKNEKLKLSDQSYADLGECLRKTVNAITNEK
jgi:hypothetical protein